MIKDILRKIRLLSNARKEPYFLFYNVLGFYPDKIDYYQLAVRHKSVSILTEDGHNLSNERLEFLGDAVLNSVVTDILYRRYEDQREGFLTNTRSKIVKRDSLNQLALEIGLDKLVKVTRYVNTHNNNNIYGNALEALMGAIYLDYGYKQCKKFVEQRLIRTFIDLDVIAENEVNFKSKLIEWCQKNRMEPEFVLVDDVLGKANKHVFTTRLIIQGKTICEASGASKKESQQLVSQIAYHQIQSDPGFLKELKQESTEIIIPPENNLQEKDV
ncbi:MAG: ribonuclease III [Bacteroidota bacterium]|nr:ribonuclease III [Bacteroidota bacterium]